MSRPGVAHERATCVYCGRPTVMVKGTYPAACSTHLPLLVVDPVYASEWATVYGAEQ